MKQNRKQKSKFLLVVIALIAASSILATNYSNFLFKADVTFQSDDFYISPTGSDSNSGTLGSPFLTIGKAQQSIQALKSAGNFGGATVYLRGGTYSLDSTINFTDDDSGTANYPITYKNYQNEKPIITGSKAITGWTPLPDNPAIYQADLASQDLSGKKISDVFFNDSKQILARTPNYVAPNFDAFNIDPKVDPYNAGVDNWFFASDANWKKDGDPETETALKYNPADLGGNQTIPNELNATATANPTNPPQIEIYDITGWFNELYDMSNVAPADNQINFLPNYKGVGDKDEYPISYKDRYLIQNYLSALDTSKEWYQDLANNKLYYMPPSSINGSTVTASTLTNDAFNFTNASYINFQGLDLEQFGGKIINMLDSHDILVKNCVLANNNDTAVNIATKNLGEQNHPDSAIPLNIILDHNNFHDIGWSGVNIELAPKYVEKLISSKITISNNIIHDIGQKSLWYYDSDGNPLYANGINFGKVNNVNYHRDTIGLDITHNEIYNTPGAAIAGAGNDNVIEYNRIYNTVLTTEDGGGIDLYMDDLINRGNVINYNYVSDTHGYGLYPFKDTTPGSKMVFNVMANSIYIDGYTSGTTVTNNILVNASNYNILNNSGRDNVYENNILVQKAGFSGDNVTFNIGTYTTEHYNVVNHVPPLTPEQIHYDIYGGVFHYLNNWYDSMSSNGYDLNKYNAEYNKNNELTNIPSLDAIESNGDSGPDLVMTNNTFKNNIVDYSGNQWDSRLNNFAGGNPYRVSDISNDQKIDNNLFWGGAKAFSVDVTNKSKDPTLPLVPPASAKEELAYWQTYGFDKNSIFVDPLFKDYANNDFSLASNSPAINMGFQPIDMSQIGPLAEDDLIQLGSVRPITFKSVYSLSGTKTSDVAHVFINGVEATSYTATTWTGNVTLSNVTNTTLSNPGDNAITITATDGSGKASNQINRYLYLHKLGDATGDSKVDYLDLSKLATSSYKDTSTGAGTNYLADFNEDNKVDIYDFSILATSWGK